MTNRSINDIEKEIAKAKELAESHYNNCTVCIDADDCLGYKWLSNEIALLKSEKQWIEIWN